MNLHLKSKIYIMDFILPYQFEPSDDEMDSLESGDKDGEKQRQERVQGLFYAS